MRPHLSQHPSKNHDICPKWYSIFRLEGHKRHQEDSSIRPAKYEVLNPSVDLDTDDNGRTVVATFELPGVEKNEIKIEVHNGILTISGEKKELLPKLHNVHSVQERTYGKFVRSLHLPNGTMVRDITANMENGVLMLSFPNPEHGQAVGQVVVG